MTNSAGAPKLNRRHFLSLGSLSLLSPFVQQLLSAKSQRRSRVKSCLVLFQAGGVSQIDTFDMRPLAVASVRGEFKAISSNVPGMPVCEHLPRLANQMDKLCVVRSMHHRMLCHNPACYCALSGRDVGESKAVSSQTPATDNDYPNFGASVARFQPHTPDLPAFVSLPFTIFNGPAKTPGQGAGMLGSRYDPYLIDKDPSEKDFRIEELEQRPGITKDRFHGRRQLQAALNGQTQGLDGLRHAKAMEVYYDRAFSLLTAKRTREAFDLSKEPDRLRDKYGRHLVGQSTLMGRRLIEAGVSFVTVYSPVQRIEGVSWDTHRNNFPLLKDTLLPPADQSFSALLEDMQQRGMLDETLVIWMSEFGRTPRIGYTQSNNTNNVDGRDHHPQCYSILLAGAGVTGGSYYGRSDKDGWHPDENPVHPGDLGATVLDAFGIDPHQKIRDPFGRPHRLCEGRPVRGLF